MTTKEIKGVSSVICWAGVFWLVANVVYIMFHDDGPDHSPFGLVIGAGWSVIFIGIALGIYFGWVKASKGK